MDLHQALAGMFKDQIYRLKGNSIVDLEWHPDNTEKKPTQAEVNAWIKANEEKEQAKVRLAQLDVEVVRRAARILEELAIENNLVYGDLEDIFNEKAELRKVFK